MLNRLYHIVLKILESFFDFCVRYTMFICIGIAVFLLLYGVTHPAAGDSIAYLGQRNPQNLNIGSYHAEYHHHRYALTADIQSSPPRNHRIVDFSVPWISFYSQKGEQSEYNLSYRTLQTGDNGPRWSNPYTSRNLIRKDGYNWLYVNEIYDRMGYRADGLNRLIGNKYPPAYKISESWDCRAKMRYVQQMLKGK